MSMPAPIQSRAVWSWALYDWANSAFATTVMAGFFPTFLKEYWSAGDPAAESTWHLGAGNAVAGLIIALLAPVLGAIADQGGVKRRFLLLFTVLGIAMTGALYFVERGDWPLAVALYVAASVGFGGSNVFYDALIVDVSGARHMDRVSALGYGLGYLGGGVLFAVNVAMTLKPQWFGLADAAEAVRLSFVSVAIWWAVFAVPVFLFVRERTPRRPPLGVAVRAGLAQLAATVHHLRSLRTVFLFLAAYWFYIDGVNTVIKMAVDYGLSLGFPSSDVIAALLLVQFIGFPAAIAFGRIGERLGTKTGLYIGIAVYTLVTVWAYALETVPQFYAMAVAIALVQGGIQSLSRSFYARIIPADKTAEFFGFYGLLGKFATILGPLLMGWVALVTGSPRLAILAVAVLFVIGAVLLASVDESRARREAAAFGAAR
jgi:UMF1 family MFS transporter